MGARILCNFTVLFLTGVDQLS